jgi:succinyl-CoA synthetase beta subunit
VKLYEYQGREILSRAGIPTPSGVVVSSLKELEARKDAITYPAVIKAQVLVGGRGKAGGVKFAENWNECRQVTEAMLGMQIKGLTVDRVMIAQKLDFAKELYVSVLIDRSSRQSLVIASAEGGVEIESVPDERIFKRVVNPLVGMPGYVLRDLGARMGLNPAQTKQFQAIVKNLYKAYRENDCELLEINPLAITGDGNLVAGDAKAILNDGALYRHPEIESVEEEYTPLEQEARKQNIAFVQLEGRIGVIANGAGLTMATLDALNEFGGKAGVFLDLGGTDNPEQVQRAFQLMKKAQPSVVLINLFGGITKCDTVAKGIKQVLDAEGKFAPIITRIKGTNAKEAKEILKDAGLETADTLQEAAEKTVALEKRTLAKPAGRSS